ncbi:MAG: argininosuccinate synthase, partial [Dehalococcoidia bacterium]
MADKAVLAYSGGLDTSVAIKWIKEKYGYDIVTFTVDIGNVANMDAIRQKALDVGAVDAVVADAREQFVSDFVFP